MTDLDPAPFVDHFDGIRHGRSQDCWVYCTFAPREGYETDVALYPVHFPSGDDE